MTKDSDRQERIVKARMRLRERFLAQRNQAESGPEAVQGTGKLNAHGMPSLPVGQKASRKWPVLDLGIHPSISRDAWKIEITGACSKPQSLDWSRLLALEQVEDVSDFHCVTTWSKLGISWLGVRFLEIAALVEPTDTASHIFIHGSDGYTTNLSLQEALKPDVLLVYQADGVPLSREHGGPVRMITPQLYAWKGAKWICGIEFLTSDRLGYWEERGYSNTARPWEDDRYS